MADVSEDTTWLTYAELAAALKITRESARQLVIRKRWPRRKGNDGLARVGVPAEVLKPPPPSDATGPATPEEPSAVTVLERHIERLEREVAEARSEVERLHATEKQLVVMQALYEVAQQQTQEFRAERDRWRVQAERVVSPPPVERPVSAPRIRASAWFRWRRAS